MIGPLAGKVRGGVGVDDCAGKRGIGEAEHDEPLAVAAVTSECPKVGVVEKDATGAGQVGGHDGVSNQLRDGKFSSRYCVLIEELNRAILRHTGTGRNKVSDNDIFL